MCCCVCLCIGCPWVNDAEGRWMRVVKEDGSDKMRVYCDKMLYTRIL